MFANLNDLVLAYDLQHNVLLKLISNTAEVRHSHLFPVMSIWTKLVFKLALLQ